MVEGYGGLSLRRSLLLIYTPGHGGTGEGVGTFLRPLFHAYIVLIILRHSSFLKVPGLERWQEIDR